MKAGPDRRYMPEFHETAVRQVIDGVRSGPSAPGSRVHGAGVRCPAGFGRASDSGAGPRVRG